MASAAAITASGGAFTAVFEPLARLFGTASDVPAVTRHLGEYNRKAADQVLAAEDRDHLLALIDALSGDDAFWEDATKAMHRAVELKLVTPRKDGVGKLDMGSLRSILGTTAAMRCQRGHRALADLLNEFKKIAARVEHEQVERVEQVEVRGTEDRSLVDMSDMLYNRETPLIIRKVIAAFLRSLASAIVIARAEERGDRLDPWLALAVAEVFAVPFESALIAIRKPDALSSAASAVAVDEQVREITDAAFSHWREHAVANGKGAYFPIDYETR